MYATRLLLFSLLLAIGTRLPVASAESADPASPFIGKWTAARTLGPEISGPITLATGTPPRATVGASTALGASKGDAVVYRFPGGLGELRTRGADPAKPGDAVWIQPPTVAGARYASPVTLEPAGPGIFRGRIAPLEDRIRLTMHVVAGDDGHVRAFLRDPFYNVGRQFPIARVLAVDHTLRFVLRDGTAIVATPNAANDAFTLRLPHAPLAEPLTFVRSVAPNALPGDAYRTPVSTGDGWDIASARDEGIAPAALVELARFAAGGEPTSISSPAVHAIVIARHGKLVFDRYFAEFDESVPHDTRSAGKTYADVLAGAAIANGASIDDTTPLLSLFPNETHLANDDPRKRTITLGNALSMATGLDCDDDDEKSAGNEDNEQNQSAQPDWYRLVLDARMVRDPGTKAVYCSASINLAGGAVAGATHTWLPFLFAERIAEPLQMQRYALNLTPTDEMYLGGGAYVRPRDFLKIGQVFLDGGTWHGRRLLDRDWIARSWQPRLALGPGDDYGYAWHVRSYVARGTTYRTYEAQGNGGQILDVLPALDLAVMMTQGNYNNFKTWGPERDAIVQRVIAAIDRP